jgi:hypothetical protein
VQTKDGEDPECEPVPLHCASRLAWIDITQPGWGECMAGVGTRVVTSFGKCGVSVRVTRVLALGVHAVILTCTFDDGCLCLVD